jgi:hypothetical protein
VHDRHREQRQLGLIWRLKAFDNLLHLLFADRARVEVALCIAVRKPVHKPFSKITHCPSLIKPCPNAHS